MYISKQIELLEKYKLKDEKGTKELIEYLYNKTGLEFITLYPKKINKEMVAKELIIKSIDRYIELEIHNTPLTTYVRRQFERKYKDFELGDIIEGNKNKKRKLKRKVLKATNNNEEEYNKLYDQYYYIIEKYLKLYPNKENKEQCAEALFRKILEKFSKEGKDHLGTYIKNYFSKNYEKYNIGDELKELTPKEPVADLIEKARIDKEARNKLIEKYIYVVEDQILNIKGFDKEELRASGYLKLVELVNKYFEDNTEFPLSVYLITRIKHYFESLQKQEQERKINISKYEVVDEYIEDITNNIINNMYLMEILKNADLTEKQRIILEYTSYYGMSLKELADMYNLTRSRTQQIYHEGIRRVRTKNNLIH